MTRFIVFEGIDAVGKTTLARLLAKETSGIYYKTPPESFRQRCIEMDSNGVIYNEGRFQLYIESVYFASNQIGGLLNEGNVVIADRWIWTTLAYHFAHNSELHKKWGDNRHDLTFKLLKPDISILLFIADDKIWLERIKKRGIDNPDRILVQNKKLRQKIFCFYQQLNPDFHLIDNSGDNNKTLKDILNLVKR